MRTGPEAAYTLSGLSRLRRGAHAALLDEALAVKTASTPLKTGSLALP
jgi:hypothetical protein